MNQAVPMPSMSTPIHSTDTRTEGERRRRRRHTIIHRPDSGMGLLSDMEDTDDPEGQETFDRISGILSSLIQEANEAVHGQELEQRVLTSHSNKRIFPSISTETSKLPRPRKSRTPHHVRNVSTSSSSSSSTTTASNLFSPISASTSTTISRSPSPINHNIKTKQLRQHYTVLRPRSCPVVTVQRRSMTPSMKQKRNNSPLIDPITESFKRLDSSIALVDSLSRDLATTTTTTTNKESNLTLLLLVPLLHIPHSLITMLFDFCTFQGTPTITRSNSSFSMSSMLFWACVFAVTNLMVDQVAVLPKPLHLSTQKEGTHRRMSLPGTYENPSLKRRTKQTWIPTTVKKSPFCLDSTLMKRRNSI